MNITDPSLALMQAQAAQAEARANNLAKPKDAARDVSESMSEKEMAKFEAAAQDFEAMFVTEMMKPMFENLKPDPRFGGGKGEEIFQGMMLQEYGKMIAETGQLGIADNIKQELIRMQAEASKGGRQQF